MRLKRYIKEESTGMGVDGLSKAKVKTLIYKETKKCTHNKLYSDRYWQGPKCIWNTFDKLNLNWNINNTQYKNNKDDESMDIKLPTRKEWYFEIMWRGPKGKKMKMGGHLTAAGAGSVDEPLSKYDLVLVLY